jgi:hypothetical protein
MHSPGPEIFMESLFLSGAGHLESLWRSMRKSERSKPPAALSRCVEVFRAALGRQAGRSQTMLDIILVAIVIAFFGLFLAYSSACEHL